MAEDATNSGLEESFKNFTSSLRSIQSTYGELLCQIRELNDDLNLPNDLLEEMAGNIAHGIRNPLGGIANFAAILSDDKNSVEHDNIKRIMEGVQRIDMIIENLIVFSRPMQPHYVKCNFVDIIEGAVLSVKNSFIPTDKQSLLTFSLPQGDITVKVDLGLIKQALQNLLKNAIEAMPDGGQIRKIKSTNEFSDDHEPG